MKIDRSKAKSTTHAQWREALRLDFQRLRRSAPRTFDQLKIRMLAHAQKLENRGYDELAEDLRDDILGDPEDAERDVYGRDLKNIHGLTEETEHCERE